MRARLTSPPPDAAEALALSTVPAIFGGGSLSEIGARAANLNLRHVLLVSDPGVVAARHPERAAHLLQSAGVRVTLFAGVEENPTTRHVASGLALAQEASIDGLIAIGGGSAMDCAKGISLLYSNGGQIGDYRGDPPADALARRRPLVPLICVPTTAGTGSEAQSFALISDAATRVKMACGDRRPPGVGLRPAVAILDPELTRTQPGGVAAAAGIDAVAHAVETSASRTRTSASRRLSVGAWERLSWAFPRAMLDPADDAARAEMLLGAHLAGAAIERSMLGAAHACANPLTARFGITHGVAVGLMLPHVVHYNATAAAGTPLPEPHPYSDLARDPQQLVASIQSLLVAAGLPRRLRDVGVNEPDLDELAHGAAQQWTGTFNPRPVGAGELRQIYCAAL